MQPQRGGPLAVGIDPGLHGAVAVLRADGSIVTIVDTPTVEVATRRTRKVRDANRQVVLSPTGEPLMKSRKGIKLLYESAEMARGIREVATLAEVTIEQAGPRPRDGTMQAFGVGYGMGIWIGLLTMAECAHLVVPPSTWKQAMQVPKDKQEARLRAMQRWPDSAQWLHLKKHEGRAEALWIAEYGRLRRAQEVTDAQDRL